MKYTLSLLAIAPLFFAATAFALPAKTDLTYSYPAADSVEREPVPFVQLGFGGAVDMVTIEIAAPDGTRTEIYNAATDLVPMKTGPMFAITLPESLAAPGKYRISYTIAVTTEGRAAQNRSGTFGFTLDLPKQAAGQRETADTK